MVVEVVVAGAEVVVDVAPVVVVVVLVVGAIVVEVGPVAQRRRRVASSGPQMPEQQLTCSRQTIPTFEQVRAELPFRSSAGMLPPAIAARTARRTVRRLGVAARSLVNESKRWSSTVFPSTGYPAHFLSRSLGRCSASLIIQVVGLESIQPSRFQQSRITRFGCCRTRPAIATPTRPRHSTKPAVSQPRRPAG